MERTGTHKITITLKFELLLGEMTFIAAFVVNQS